MLQFLVAVLLTFRIQNGHREVSRDK